MNLDYPMLISILYGINCEVLGRVVYIKEHGYVPTKLSGDDLNIRCSLQNVTCTCISFCTIYQYSIVLVEVSKSQKHKENAFNVKSVGWGGFFWDQLSSRNEVDLCCVVHDFSLYGVFVIKTCLLRQVQKQFLDGC